MDTHKTGDTLKLGICSHWGKLSDGSHVAVSPHLSKTEVDTTVDTHTTGEWGYSQTGHTLTLGTKSQTAVKW